ncbi:LamG-like jellyroll fold domain-containing protein [Paraburkholderia phymatum]|uniref:Uncharacterized protein n=1 Tax=Paraburkholderia phymatum (strain DSM 17167 / CIP 108236 / LMG 21445 / STM815) TaxID=391038 RepID=B2JUJ0_PARP8|nr:LamG-like jellyroll fold domain-containing protein [Paraburkholderia phymatum]ACC76161.1 hypothetical protein Bphy_7160 [Paraburkholderia phymatum STM815]
MALLFCDSFDAYSAKADVLSKWGLGSNGSAWNNFGTFSASGGKFGGGSINIGGTSAGAANQILASPVGFTYSAGYTICMAGYVKFSSVSSAGAGFMGLSPNGTTAGMFDVTTSGLLKFYPFGSGSPNATTGTRNLADNNWHWFEAKVVLNTASTGSVTCYVDGTLELSLTSLATISAGTPSGFVLGSLYQANTNFDDVTFWDTSGAAFNSFPIGPRRIGCLNPSSAGDSTQFTPSAGANYSCVSQAYSGSAYVSDTGSGNTDLYHTPGLGYTPLSAINAAVLNVFGYNPAGDGTRSITPKLKSVSTVASGSVFTLPGVAQNVQRIFYTDASGAAWTATNINAAQPGIGD